MLGYEARREIARHFITLSIFSIKSLQCFETDWAWRKTFRPTNPNPNPSSSTELFTALHLGTYRTGCSTSLICRRDAKAGCARRPPVSSTSARRDLLLLAIARLLLPARDSGTVYLSTSSLPRHSQHFVINWKLIYFGNIQTLFFNCFAIVVLEVSFT